MASVCDDDLDVSGMDAEDSTANEESFYSGDEAQNHSGNESDEETAERTKIVKDSTKSLASGLANCSISPERRAARLSSADLDESLSDEEIPEVASREKQSKEPGVKADPARPKFTEMIIEAMVSAGPSRSGVSVQQIKKSIHLKYPDVANKSEIYFRKGLKYLVDTDKMIQVTGTGANGSYKLVKTDQTKAASMSKAPAASAKAVSKAGPKSSKTGKFVVSKASNSKSPMKSSGKAIKAAVTKTSVSVKSASVRLTKLSNASKSKAATSNGPPKSDTVAGTTKPRGRPAKNGEADAAKSPVSRSKSGGAKSDVPSKVSTKVRTGSAKFPAKPKSATPKSPAKPKSVAPKSPKPKSAASKSPKPISVATKLPKPKSAASKSPNPQSVIQRSPAPRVAASKTKLDSASDSAEKRAPGPASKRGKK